MDERILYYYIYILGSDILFHFNIFISHFHPSPGTLRIHISSVSFHIEC